MSPDLNPIEHLWDKLEYIKRSYSEFHTVGQLEQALLYESKMIPQNELASISHRNNS